MNKRYLVATDMGGTFVDAVIWDLYGSGCSIGKAPSTSADPPEGIYRAIAAAAARGGLQTRQVLDNAALVLNGTTVTTNAMIERKGSPTGLLVTAGFEDTLQIARVIGRTVGLDETQLLDYRNSEPPPQIVPRSLVRGVIERIDAQGVVVCPLNLKAAMEAVDELVAAGIEALAISFLWSFRNPAHERSVRDAVEERYPGLFVVASSDLVPILGEYERTNTTAINAYLGRTFERYARGLRERMSGAGALIEPLIMQSVGGLAPAKHIERVPVTTLFSGPVGGVIAGLKLGEQTGRKNFITADMGGTSFDVGLILDGQHLTSQQTVIERQLVAIPTVELVTIGAGGGSVAAVTEAGFLQVGPRSMGAVPGPACYQRGGTLPTVTDANVVLGFVVPDYFLGGEMKISSERSVTAIREHVSDKLGMDVIEGAAAIHTIVNAHMADLIRRASIERGHDPRSFTLLPFGGCGPVHGAVLGSEIGSEDVVVPPGASAFSAMGISQSDIRHALVRSFPHVLRAEDGTINDSLLDELNVVIGEFSQQALDYVHTAGLDPAGAVVRYFAELRYQNQIRGLLIPLLLGSPARAELLRQIVGAFEREYERLYGAGASSPRTRIEWISVRSDVIVPAPHSPKMTGTTAAARTKPSKAAILGRREMYSLTKKKMTPVQVYQAESLRPGDHIEGAALIVSYGFTIPIHEGQGVDVDALGNFIVKMPH